jgi:hypothetical protein
MATTQADVYNIKVGQRYHRADGAEGVLVVVDVDKYAHTNDVIVFDETQGVERTIDCFKLAMVRYYLEEPK